MNLPLYRLGLGFSACIIGAVIASLWLIPTSSISSVAQALGMLAGIVGASWCFSAEQSAIEVLIDRAVYDARSSFLAQKSRPAVADMQPIPEAARPLHEDMTDAVAQARESVARMAKVASAMDRDRRAVHDRCELLEQENEHLATQVEAAHQARNVLALLPAPPLRIEGQKVLPKVDTEGFMQRLTEQIAQRPEEPAIN
jgi:hypothetical protein